MKTAATLIVLGIVSLAALAVAEPPIPENYPISSYSPELQNEEQIWTCPTDSTVIIAVWRDFRLGYRQVGIGRSSIVNNFWQDSLIHPDMQVFMQQSDPCLTVDNNGNFYICVLDYQPNATSIWDSSYISVLKSTDKGVSWTGPVTVEHALGPYFEDKQFTVVDRTNGPYSGNYYVAWARFPNPNRIMFVRSTDGAQTFEDTVIVGPNIDGTPCGWGILDAGQFACPAVGSDGAVYVMWIGGDLDTTTCDYYTSMKMVKSVDGGASFTEPGVIRHTVGNWGEVDGGVDVYNQPVVATDVWGGAHDGNIYVAYANMDIDNWEFQDYNIEFIRSTSGGAGWSDPVYINDDYVGVGAPYDQFHPWLICNEEGTLVCLWYDQRTDVVNHFKFDAFAAYSFDGGETFTTNHRISDFSIDPGNLKLSGRTTSAPDDPRMELTSGLSPRAGLIAEYIGVTAFNDHINATWTDTRNGNQDVFGANWTIPFMKPRLLTPEDGTAVTDATPTFRWSTTWKEDDDSYRLEVAEDSLFASIVFSSVATDNQRTYAGPPLVLDEEYFWRVKAFRTSAGDSSEYSEVYSFSFSSTTCFATGDVDNDGLPLSVADMIYLSRFVEGTGPAPPVLYSGDMNGDCEIDHLDVALYQDYITYGMSVFTNGYPVPTCCEVTTTRGACCLPDTCFTLSPGNCAITVGGVYEGDGTYCIDDPCACCIGIRGNVDNDSLDVIDISDLVYLVDYMFNGGPDPLCIEEADIDGSGGSTPTDIADLVHLVDYMFNGGAAPVDCP